MPYYPIQGYAPDADPTTPGVLKDVDLLIPTLTGMKALPSDSDPGFASVGSAVRSASILSDIDSNLSVYVGTADNLYKQATATWSEISSSTNAYSLSARARWTFDSFNIPGDDRALAAAHGQDIQFSSGGDFADLTGAPKVAFICVAEGFLMGANFGGTSTVGSSSVAYIAAPNRWMCAGRNTTNVWDPSIATQATTGLLTDSPGGITGLHALGTGIVAYKDRSMFFGRYVGPPQVWRFSRIFGDGLGAPSHHSVVDIETAHLFPGVDNFYLYDGTRPTPIGTNTVAEFFMADLNQDFRDQIVGFHDLNDHTVFWWYPSTGSSAGALDKFICYNYRSGKWGGGTKSVSFALEWTATGLTYNDIGTFYTTYDDLPTAPYDTAFASTATLKPAIFNTDNELKALEGTPANESSYTLWDMGQDHTPILFKRIRPRFKKAPTSGSHFHAYRDVLGEDDISSGGATLQSGTFDYVEEARWHQIRHTYTGDMEILGVDVEFQGGSEE